MYTSPDKQTAESMQNQPNGLKNEVDNFLDCIQISAELSKSKNCNKVINRYMKITTLTRANSESGRIV